MTPLSGDRSTKRSWQASFLRLLPQIHQRLKHSFRYLDPASKDEAVQSAVVLCLCSYARLYARRRAHAASASTLVFYAVKQVKCGRPAAGRMNARDPLSRYAQLRRRLQVDRSHVVEPNACAWIDSLIDDKRASIPELVTTRIDSRTWFEGLRPRDRKIAADLAVGCTTSEVAQKYEVSAGRISQLRRELENSWKEFQKDVK